MHVEIDHESAPDPSRALQAAERDGHVVEDAEAAPAVGMCVVRAAGEVARDAAGVGERGETGAHRALYGEAAAAPEARALRQAHAPLGGPRECAAGERVEVLGRVDEQEIAPVGLARRHDGLWRDDAFPQQDLVERRELAHRERVLLGERDDVAGVIGDAQRGQ